MKQVNLPEKVYFKEGCTPVALRELAEIYHRKRVLLVAGLAALRAGTVMALSRFFEKRDIQTAEVIVSDAFPTCGDLQEPLHKVQEFLPDVILGVGSDGVLSAAKGLRFLYENPGTPLEQADYVSGLQAGEKALLVLMGTTLDGGLQNSTLGIFSNGEHPVAVSSLAFLPLVAITDGEFVRDLSAGEIRKGIETILARCLAAYLGKGHSEYTDSFLAEAIGTVLRWKDAALAGDPAGKTHLLQAASLGGAAYGNTSHVYVARPVLADLKEKSKQQGQRMERLYSCVGTVAEQRLKTILE